MDILDIFLDILLKPPQPLIGLFLNEHHNEQTTKHVYLRKNKLFIIIIIKDVPKFILTESYLFVF